MHPPEGDAYEKWYQIVQVSLKVIYQPRYPNSLYFTVFIFTYFAHDTKHTEKVFHIGLIGIYPK